MKQLNCNYLFQGMHTIAKEIFEGVTYPFEVLPKISEFIVKLGQTLPTDKYEFKGENVWIATSAKVAPTASITGPAIIDEEAEIRHCAFIRGNAIVGKNAVVGNSTELKNVILFDCVQVPHYNYVGDSVLGFHAHMGAGSITSNIKSDRTNVVIKDSFANSAVPYLISSYKRIIMIDLRYYGGKSLLTEMKVQNPDRVVVWYETLDYATETRFAQLLR